MSELTDAQLKDYAGRTRSDAIRSVRKALNAAERTEAAVSLWCDTVSQIVERRLNVAFDSPARWEDPEYRLALDVYSDVRAMVMAAEKALAHIEDRP